MQRDNMKAVWRAAEAHENLDHFEKAFDFYKRY